MEVAAELRGEGAVGLVYRLIDHSFTFIATAGHDHDRADYG